MEYKPGELQGSGGGGVTRNTNQGSCRGVEVGGDTEYKPGELQGSGGGGVTRNTNQGSCRGVEVGV